MKRTILILFIACAGVMWRAYDLLPDVSAQRTVSAKPSKFAKFTHKSHVSKVKSLISSSPAKDLSCAYCHGTAAKDKLGKDQHDIENIGYPSHKEGLKEAKTHSACTECHAFTGSATPREMCAICHDKLVIDPKVMATNIRRFPNPDGDGLSQFYDNFSHGGHVDYYEQNAAALEAPLKGRVKFFNSKATDPKENKGLDKNKFECASCHTKNEAPVTFTKINFAADVRTGPETKLVAGVKTFAKLNFNAGVKMSAPGHPECFICHFDPKIVSPPKSDKPNPKNTFATNCIGCHTDTGKPPKADRPVTGSEPAVLWFARQIVNTELNPAKQGAKSPLPFSHKTHDDAVGKTVADCLTCHATAKTAATLKDFYLEDRKTREKQPTALGCVECHKKDGMQTKIEGAVTLETAKCNYCHSISTIKAYGAKGIALPPPSHFGKKAIQATPAPATTPGQTTTQPPKPTPAPTPAQTKPPEAQAPVTTSTSTPAQTSPAATAPTTPATTSSTSAPPRPSPAPTPAPTRPEATSPTSGTANKPAPTGIVRLGDPKESPHWGQHDRWGVVENFNHGDHVKPAFSQRCEDCHHTNKDAKVEAVPKCISCHKETGDPDTDSKGGGVNVKDAYHGIAGSSNTKIKAGCIECHKTYRDEKNHPDTKAPIKDCGGCHTEKKAWLDPRKLKPLRGERAGENEIAMRQWIYDFRSIARR